MKELLNKIFNKIMDTWYGILPFLILFGIPTVLCIIIGWDKIVGLYNALIKVGNGSIFCGIVIFVLKLIGAINLLVGFILTLEAISKKLSQKWIYIYIIATLLSIIIYRNF